jgi:hypothetical protein
MDLILFLNDIFYQIFNINLNKLHEEKFYLLKRFFKNIPRIFFKKQSQM